MEFTPQFFDEASKAWKANKVRVGEGHYRYKKNAFVKEKPVLLEKPSLQKKLEPRRSPRFTASK
jgi:hypothetical protein